MIVFTDFDVAIGITQEKHKQRIRVYSEYQYIMVCI